MWQKIWAGPSLIWTKSKRTATFFLKPSLTPQFKIYYLILNFFVLTNMWSCGAQRGGAPPHLSLWLTSHLKQQKDCPSEMGIHLEAFSLVKRTSTMNPPKVLSGSDKWPYATHRGGERIRNKKQWFNFWVVILWEILRTKLWANFDNLWNMTVNVLCEQKSQPRLGFNLFVTFVDVGTRSMCTAPKLQRPGQPPPPLLHYMCLD